jgi:8-amino-7-oxononanoate synthase
MHSATPDALKARWRDALDARAREGRLRALPQPRVAPNGQPAVDFASNDYLGLGRSSLQQQTLADRLRESRYGASGGSRLLTGNHPAMEALERKAAAFHGAASGLLFGSGYHANAGLIATLARTGDVLLYDRLVHACMHEGMKLSSAVARPFAHNDVKALAAALQWAGEQRSPEGQVFVLVESVYSMDGDVAPLPEMAALCLEHGAHLVVDEAHGAGVLGPNGAGAVAMLPEDLQEAVLARVVTYGKAFGASGGMVLGPALLREYLVNYCKPFLYTTAPHAAQVESIDLAYDAVEGAHGERRQLAVLRKRLLEGLRHGPYAHLLADAGPAQDEAAAAAYAATSSAVLPIALPQAVQGDRNHALMALSDGLLQRGFDLRAIRSPTVPAGTERLRCCLHAFNSPEEVDGLLAALNGLAP